MNILIVDDMAESIYLLQAMLEGAGYGVVSARNGKEALERLREETFALIVADILMPVMDGFQFCRECKINPEWREIPFVFYTATYTGPQDEEFALKVGADRFIRKPCEPDVFLEAIQNVTASAKKHRLSTVEASAPEEEVLKLYNARLIRKLEQKMLEVEKESQARKEAEDALRISNLRLQLALAASNIGLWDWNLETNAVWFSPEWKSQIGYEDREMVNRYEEWETRLHPEDRPLVLAELNAYLEGRIPVYSVEFRFRHRNGAYRWIHAQGEKIHNAGGKSGRMTGCHLDITPLKEVIQALEAEKGNFQVLVDASPLGIALAGKDERFRYLNPKFVELFGYNLNHIPSQQDWLVKAYPDPKYREEIIAMWKEAKRRDDPGVFRTRTFTVTCKDGTEKAVQIRAAFLADGDHVVTYEDISEQIHLENKLRQAQKMEAIATLAGGIAHDFNNILSAVIGYAELIRFDLPAGSKASQNLTQVLTAGLRAKELVKQILTFSRQADQDQIPIEPHLVVKEALKLLRSTLPTTIEIHQDLTPSGTILADPTQIHQVIMNLCTNAYHAMREKGGTLEVRMKPVALDSSLKKADSDLTAGKYVRLTVEDTGCGMPSEVANRIFDPYFTTKSEGEGTGLGLAVVNGIIKNHHGTITVSSEPGRGSVFTVYFPQIEHGAGAERESHEAPLPTGTEHILFVDDEPTLANLGKRMLEILGYRVEVCTSATDALDLFRKKPERFDLIITDMTMPAMTGSELAMALLQVRPNIPIILCTGFSYGMSEEKAKAIGIREFIFKPFVQKDMATAIRKALI